MQANPAALHGYIILQKKAETRFTLWFRPFYTAKFGLGNRFSLTEVRVLYELAHRRQTTAVEIGRELALDAGYLSRMLARFERQAWLKRQTSPRDGRQLRLTLTPAGRAVFEPLQERSREAAAALLAPLSARQRGELLGAMATIQQALEPKAAAPTGRPTRCLREHGPGDLGWIVAQHGELYAREFGWDASFEAMVAEIAAGFLRRFDPQWERCWIAELRGERVGSVVLVRKSANVAQLRLLIVRPEARGLGLGAELADQCITFARERGYRKLMLWTHGNLAVARALYSQRGFELKTSEPYRAFGQDLISETWQLRL